MLYKEDVSYQYTFFLEEEALLHYANKYENPSVNYLRYKVSSHLFEYLENKFLKNIESTEYFYKFTHADVNIYLITNDRNKINEISSFLKVIMEGNKLMEIYSESIKNSKFSKKYEINSAEFNLKLDKFYDYYILQNELANNTININKKAKI